MRWRDIDFSTNTIAIRNVVVQVKALIEHEQTKSRASKRTMHIIPETRGCLQDLKQRQAENRRLMGAAYEEGDHVCVRDNGEPFKPEYIPCRFGQILKMYGLPKMRFHELRHTAGSLLLNKGLSIKQI